MNTAAEAIRLRTRVGSHSVDLVFGGPRPGTSSWLSPDEEDRAARFRFDSDRQRFIGRRLALRSAVAAEIGTTPASVRFSFGRYGRPEVEGGSGLSFSGSSAGDTSVVAFCRTATIGADIVRITSGIFDRSTAAVVFHPTELCQVEAADDQDASFAILWARKEAFAKADGRGLGGYVRTVDLSGASPLRRTDTVVADIEPGIEGIRGHAIAVAVRSVRAPRTKPDPQLNRRRLG